MTRWFGRLSIRARLMAVGLAGVAGALAVGGVLLYALTGASLDSATERQAQTSASDIAALVDAGRLPDPVPVSGALVVQILDGRNRVISGSASADRLTSTVTDAERVRLARGQVLRVPASRVGMSGELLVVGTPAHASGQDVLVLAGLPTGDLETSRRVLRTFLLVFFPLFLLAIGLIAYRVVGMALRPVDRLRQGAERIGASADLEERLPVLAARDEISALAQTLNAMLGRLALATDKQRTFVADAAHELRSPLASLQTQVEVAQRLGEGGTLPAELLPDIRRLTSLVDDLLTLARSGAQAPTPDHEPVDLAEVADLVVARYAAARVPVRRADGGAGPTVLAARADLDRALTNLVDNAVRHAASQVTVTVRVEGTAGFEVQDDGDGIAEADRERVFDRFARLDDARARDSGGTGLGLPITRELLRRNHARVWIEDAAPGVRAVVAFDPS